MSEENKPVEPIKVDKITKPAPAIEATPIAAGLPAFVTLAKLPAVAAVKAEIKLPPNNIKFEVTQDVLEQIKPGSTVQANFFALGIKIRYRSQQNDSAANSLERLRDAIFAVKLGQPLPDYCSVESVNSYTGGVLAAHLSTGISEETGDCDCRIEVFV